MSLLPLFIVLLFAAQCIAQRLTPDLITVSNFLPRPSANTLPAPARPVPPLAVISVPTSQNDISVNPVRILPLTRIFRCDPKNTHAHPKTHKLLSQCRENTFCSSSGPTNGTCVPILCRRDEFPFGFGFGGGNTGITDPNIKLNELNLPIPVPKSTIRKSKKDRPKDLTTTMALPDLCGGGTFCPDDGSGCRLQSGVGGPCELGRDEQCAQPANLSTKDSTLPSDIVAEVPICLHLTCTYRNATLNQPCIIENTTYVTDLHIGDPNGDGEATYIMSVIKHNCHSPTLFFCDPETNVAGRNSPTCQPTKELKGICRFDAECASGNCAPDAWQWGATGFSFGAWLTKIENSCTSNIVMVAISILLTFVHRRHRHERYKELREYDRLYSLRRSILALHAAAAERYSDEKTSKKP